MKCERKLIEIIFKLKNYKNLNKNLNKNLLNYLTNDFCYQIIYIGKN